MGRDVVCQTRSVTMIAKLAGYGANRFATDTRKGWLQLEWAY